MNVSNVIAEYDLSEKKFDLVHFSGEIIKCEENKESSLQRSAEAIAARFIYHPKKDPVTKSTCYPFQPMITYTDADGNLFEDPSISDITPEIIDYWENRAEHSVNPLLKSQYAGLVWEFKKIVTGEKPDIKYAKIHIDSTIDVINLEFDSHPLIGAQRAERVICLSKSIDYDNGLCNAKTALFTLIGKHGADGAIGIWGMPYRISKEHKGVFSKEELSSIINDAEARFQRIVDDGKNPWLVLDVADLLATFYNKENRKEEIHALYKKALIAFEQKADSLSKMQMIGNYQRLLDSISIYGLKDLSAEITLKMEEAGNGIKGEMSPFSQTFEIKREDFENHVNFFLDGTTQDVFEKFAFYYIPDKEQAKLSVQELAKHAPLTFMVATQLFDHDGRVKSIVNGIESDLEGHIVLHISQEMNIQDVFVNAIIEKGKKRGIFTFDNVHHFLFESPIFTDNHRVIIEMGLKAFFAEDYITSLHLLIPQIEDVIRTLCKLSGIPIIKRKDKGNGFTHRILDELLRDPQVIEVLTENFANYLRILLTDDRGWNLRNEICHGIAPLSLFNSMSANRILHALIVLGMFKEQTG